MHSGRTSTLSVIGLVRACDNPETVNAWIVGLVRERESTQAWEASVSLPPICRLSYTCPTTSRPSFGVIGLRTTAVKAGEGGKAHKVRRMHSKRCGCSEARAYDYEAATYGVVQ